MITIIAKSTVKAGMAEDFKRAALPLVEASQKEDGCISYDLYEDINDPCVLTFIEQWKDKDAIDRHNDSSHFKRIVPQLGEFREGPPQVNLYRLSDF